MPRCRQYDVPVVFFFQAEDGIRDLTVTGVQTCALPISWLVATAPAALWRNESPLTAAISPAAASEATEIGRASCGKECRSLSSPLLSKQRQISTTTYALTVTTFVVSFAVAPLCEQTYHC